MEKVTDILNRKQQHFRTVKSNCAASDALYQMSCENVEHLAVMDGDRFMGMITEHDIASKGMFSKKPLNKIHVKEVMNTGLPVITTDDTVERCMKLMQQHKVRYLPVFEGFHFMGVVSSDDIIEEAVSNRDRIFDPVEARR
ncbi:MAG: CBS domain-containing protein [Bacteroidota bacterium]|nr:CBS domain-containing protein [Bacteroidota bacterium]